MGIYQILTVVTTVVIAFIAQTIIIIKHVNRMAHEKKLQESKNKLDGRLHVTKTRFDAEFVTYKEIAKAFFHMQVSISTIYLPPNSIPGTPTYGSTRRISYENCANHLKNAEAALYENAPFINNDLYTKLHNFFQQCANFFIDYYAEYGSNLDNGNRLDIKKEHWAIGQMVEEKWNELRDDIKQHIFSLEIID